MPLPSLRMKFNKRKKREETDAAVRFNTATVTPRSNSARSTQRLPSFVRSFGQRSRGPRPPRAYSPRAILQEALLESCCQLTRAGGSATPKTAIVAEVGAGRALHPFEGGRVPGLGALELCESRIGCRRGRGHGHGPMLRCVALSLLGRRPPRSGR